MTYLVTKLDTVTRTEVKVPINEIASSHMARRTFIGNIYKLVKDPNLFSVYLDRCCNCYCQMKSMLLNKILFLKFCCFS